MKRNISSEQANLFLYFGGIILLGSFILLLPSMWAGQEPLRYVDTLFTATSAVCVTGLITVDTAQYTRLGQTVILFMIQAGGLGIITFATLFLASPRKKISFVNTGIIKKYYIENIEFRPLHIIRNIIILTMSLELVGAVFLFFGFREKAPDDTLFVSLFHSVSAFCNAGFSTFSDNLEGFTGSWVVNVSVMGLIVGGGLGFLVIQDMGKKLRNPRKRLQLHSTLALSTTLVLIAGGAFVYYLFERDHAFSGFPRAQAVMAAFFQSITTRTAGFDTVNQANLSLPSQIFTLPLMLIGGSSGSTAGGIKTTTFFLILYSVLKGTDRKSEIRIGRYKISSETLDNAFIFTMKAILLICISIFCLSIAESDASVPKRFLEIVFECFSAFGTVGLSLGITAKLTVLGKLIIILTMFAGRVGLIAMAIPFVRRDPGNIDYPKGEVLVG